jgi:hypothetical protein
MLNPLKVVCKRRIVRIIERHSIPTFSHLITVLGNLTILNATNQASPNKGDQCQQTIEEQ